MTKNLSLSENLKFAVDHLLTGVPLKQLVKAASDLSSRYRGERLNRPFQKIDFMDSSLHRLAYLAVRLPATYAVVKNVFDECLARMPDLSLKSIADIGSGPGTAAFAALETFSSIEKMLFVEKDKNLIEIGRKLIKDAYPSFKNAVWQHADLNQVQQFEKQDLSVLSYVIGELSVEVGKELIKKIWESTEKVLILIEPGTPHGFSRILEMRTLLIELGAQIVAPCPHHHKCPMKGSDWCHFSVRLERSSLHKEVKDVEMGYEDEKYSYIIASKIPVQLTDARILRHPEIHSGHVDFVLCEKSGLEKKVIVSKKMKDFYKAARKLEWGDIFSHH